MKLNKLIILICLFLSQINILKAQQISKTDSTLKFLNFLESQNEYQLAGKFLIDSYKNDSTKISSILYSKLYNYGLLKNIILHTDTNPTLLFKLNKFDFIIYNKSRIKLGLSIDTNANQFDNQTVSVFKSAVLLKTKNFETANKILLATPNCNVCNELRLKTEQGKSLKYKSKSLATTLSAIVPGLGKIYLKRNKDGFSNFVVVSTMIGQAVYGFNKYGVNSTFAWINGLVGTGFYFGGIYGSYQGAKKYNQLIDNEYQKQIDEILLSY